MEPLEIIQIDEDNRVVVYYDEGTEDPREWGWDVQVLEMIYRYGYEAENPNGEELVNVFNQVYDRTGSLNKATRAMRLWMYLTGETRVVEFRDVIVYRDVYSYWVIGESTEEIDSFMKVFSKWMNGEVYLLCHEKRERFTNADGSRELDIWEAVDWVGGNYLDNKYTAKDAARVHFWLGIDN